MPIAYANICFLDQCIETRLLIHQFSKYLVQPTGIFIDYKKNTYDLAW